jgi:hypothetical protein
LYLQHFAAPVAVQEIRDILRTLPRFRSLTAASANVRRQRCHLSFSPLSTTDTLKRARHRSFTLRTTMRLS